MSISVAMATYNGENYLAEQLDSILAQSFSATEIIVVDDCSTDSTCDILNEYALRFPQIKLYRNVTNLGVVNTFEYALTLCSGEFIALSDQDDYWLPTKLELLMKNIGSNWLIHSDALIVDEKLDVVNHSYSRIKAYHDGSFVMYLIRNNVTGCTVLLKRDLLNVALPFPPNVIMHDHYLALCAQYYRKLSYLDQPLVKYRQHSSNLVGSGELQTYRTMIDHYKKHILFLDGLKLARIQFEIPQLKITRNYFEAVVNARLPKWSTFCLVNKLFGLKSVLVLFIYTAFGKCFASFVFCRK